MCSSGWCHPVRWKFFRWDRKWCESVSLFTQTATANSSQTHNQGGWRQGFQRFLENSQSLQSCPEHWRSNGDCSCASGLLWRETACEDFTGSVMSRKPCEVIMSKNPSGRWLQSHDVVFPLCLSPNQSYLWCNHIIRLFNVIYVYLKKMLYMQLFLTLCRCVEGPCICAVKQRSIGRRRENKSVFVSTLYEDTNGRWWSSLCGFWYFNRKKQLIKSRSHVLK